MVRIARYHNVFGPEGHGTTVGREPPAEVGAEDGIVEIWGDGKQTRSFLYIEKCIEGTRD
jgi:GDP-D-mannose 3', 5'-epimerase